MMVKVPFAGCCWQSRDEFPSEESSSPIDATSFKAAMSRLASGVAVVTTGDNGVCNGMTATAICSVSAEPPLVVAVLNCASRTNALIRGTGAFAINVLVESQQHLAVRFSTSFNKSFEDIAHRIGQTGSPLLDASVAVFECRLHSAHEVATHTMFVGQVVNILARSGPPLIRYNGEFTRLHLHVPDPISPNVQTVSSS